MTSVPTTKIIHTALKNNQGGFYIMKRLLTATMVLLGLTGAAFAQDYPNRNITMIIPFAPGGPTDLLGRALAQQMGEALGQTVIVENIGGAGGMNGSKRVADAKPDGYTFGVGTVGTHAQNQTLYTKPAYNSVTDFTPVALVAEVPIVLIVRKELPVNNFKEFVAYAKANHSKMQFASGGAGAASHLGCVVLNTAMGVNITHVPFRGGGPALQEVMGGRIDYQCEILSSTKSHLDSDKVKVLAILDKKRSPVAPNLPTAKEQGLEVLAYTWNALFLPKGVPADIVKKLNAAAVKAMKSPAVREKLEAVGVEFASDDRSTPEYLAQFVKDEIVKWRDPIKASGVEIK
jgi:tripartite-type tricarboxylate transporter receptor subunit TctC